MGGRPWQEPRPGPVPDTTIPMGAWPSPGLQTQRHLSGLWSYRLAAQGDPGGFGRGREATQGPSPVSRGVCLHPSGWAFIPTSVPVITCFRVHSFFRPLGHQLPLPRHFLIFSSCRGPSVPPPCAPPCAGLDTQSPTQGSLQSCQAPRGDAGQCCPRAGQEPLVWRTAGLWVGGEWREGHCCLRGWHGYRQGGSPGQGGLGDGGSRVHPGGGPAELDAGRPVMEAGSALSQWVSICARGPAAVCPWWKCVPS